MLPDDLFFLLMNKFQLEQARAHAHKKLGGSAGERTYEFKHTQETC